MKFEIQIRFNVDEPAPWLLLATFSDEEAASNTYDLLARGSCNPRQEVRLIQVIEERINGQIASNLHLDHAEGHQKGNV